MLVLTIFGRESSSPFRGRRTTLHLKTTLARFSTSWPTASFLTSRIPSILLLGRREFRTRQTSIALYCSQEKSSPHAVRTLSTWPMETERTITSLTFLTPSTGMICTIISDRIRQQRTKASEFCCRTTSRPLPSREIRTDPACRLSTCMAVTTESWTYFQAQFQ